MPCDRESATCYYTRSCAPAYSLVHCKCTVYARTGDHMRSLHADCMRRSNQTRACCRRMVLVMAASVTREILIPRPSPPPTATSLSSLCITVPAVLLGWRERGRGRCASEDHDHASRASVQEDPHD